MTTRFSLSIFLLFWLCSFHSCLANNDDDRKPSVFQIGDDLLALPDVFSNLDFAADNTPADENNIEAQMKLRNSRFWGRLYLDGWPQTIQFFRAHFGTAPPTGKNTFIFVEPRDACSDFSNSDLITNNHILLVPRGNCTFGAKAKMAQKHGAGGIVIINNEPGLEHLPGPDAHDINFSVSSIPQLEGQLLEGAYSEASLTLGPVHDTLQGYLVPINCENSGARCLPATYEERREISELSEGGVISVQNKDEDPSHSLSEANPFTMEYLLAHFGVKVPSSSQSFPLVVAKPADACSPIENDVKGKIVLVRRGDCPFLSKANHVQEAGGKAMVVGSSYPHITRMGVDPRWKGLSTTLPLVMVSNRAYSTLVAEAFEGSRISFFESGQISTPQIPVVRGEDWEEIETLSRGEGWPRTENFIRKKFEKELERHAKWPDRLISLRKAFDQKMSSLPLSPPPSPDSSTREEL